MATIRRSGSGWQALIRKKEYVGPKAKTFRSKAQAQLWANAVEGSLKRPEELGQQPHQILKEAIDLFIEGPLLEHLSGHNEQYPLRAMANSWIGEVQLNALSIRHSTNIHYGVSCNVNETVNILPTLITKILQMIVWSLI